MTVADHIVVGEVGFAAWQSSDAFKGVDLSADVLQRTRKAYEIFATETKGDIWIAELDGRGIGRALVLYVCERIKADGHETATIHTHARNTGAIRLYERCGFKIVWRGIEPSKSMGVDLEKIHLAKPLD